MMQELLKRLITKGMAKEKYASVLGKLKKIKLSSVWAIICNGKVEHHRKSKAQEVQVVRVLNYLY